MELKALFNYVTAGDLNTITIPDCPQHPTVAALEIDGEEVFRDTYTPTPEGTLTLHGLGDIILSRTHDSDSPLATIRLLVVSTRIIASLTLTILRSPVAAGSPFLVNLQFLTTTGLTLTQPGEPVTITAVGSDVDDLDITHPGGRTTQLPGTVLGTATDIHGNPLGPAAMRYTYTPATPGLYTLTLGQRRHNILVAPMPGTHAITYTNIYGAKETIRLKAKLTNTPARAASTASVGSTYTEYDVRVTPQIELSAKAIPPALIPAIMAMPWARDITIDGSPVSIEELKPEYSPESGELAEIKFTGRLLAPLHGHDIPRPENRIFRQPYKNQFT